MQLDYVGHDSGRNIGCTNVIYILGHIIRLPGRLATEMEIVELYDMFV